MDKNLFLGACMATFSSSFCDNFKGYDTTKARKTRKERARVLTMLHEAETKGMASKRKLSRSKRRNRK